MRSVRGIVRGSDGSTNWARAKSALPMPFIDLIGSVGELEQPRE